MANMLESVTLTPPPDLRFRNLDAAINWIGETFGFEQYKAVKNAAGELQYVEMVCGSSTLILASLSDEADTRNKGQERKQANQEAQTCCVLVSNIDELRVRVERAGVDIVYDSRSNNEDGKSFVCRDLDGHLWFFADQKVETSENLLPPPESPVPSRLTSWISIAALFAVIAGGGALLLLLGTNAAGPGQIETAVNGQLRSLSGDLSEERKARRLADERVNELKSKLQQNNEALEKVRAAASRAEHDLRVERSRRVSAESSIAEMKSIKLKLRELREQVRRTAALSSHADLSIKKTVNKVDAAAPKTVTSLLRPPRQVNKLDGIPSTAAQASPQVPEQARAPLPTAASSKAQVRLPRPLRWRRVGRQRSSMSDVRSLAVRLRSAGVRYHTIGVKALHRDVDIRSVHVLYKNGSRQVLPLNGVIRDESRMRTYRLRNGRGGAYRVLLRHKSTFNAAGPGSVEIWMRQSELPRQAAAAR